jgi:hypothetical protein
MIVLMINDARKRKVTADKDFLTRMRIFEAGTSAGSGWDDG